MWYSILFAIPFLLGGVASAAPKKGMNPSSESRSPPSVWCKNPSPLGVWKEGGREMNVSYCLVDSAGGQGLTVFSRLDVRQEDVATGKVAWKIHDEVGAGLRNLRLIRPSFAKLDIDGDGAMEIFFGYYFAAEGADPIQVKFMSHMGGKKYAIRGAIPMIEDDSSAFKMDFDPGFTSAPTRLKVVADSLFRKFAIRLCEDPDLGYGIPVPPQLRR